ncbi:MAG: RNA polymerase sigma factor [Patulibacter sp.]|nr:RNA polymerase sigma factor [Patulibacter sp.]
MRNRRPARGDARLVARISAGDDAAWETLDRRHRRRLRRYAASLSRPGIADPDDVAQDVLLRAHQALRSGTVPERLDAWLLQLTRNAVIDAARARTRRPESPLDSVAEPTTPDLPETIVLRREHLRRTVDDIAQLPDTQRTALLGCAVDGRPAEDVADELGVSAPAVHMAVRRARQSLVRTASARDAACDGVRDLLDDAHARGVRPAEQARLHVRDCPACADYRQAQRRLDRRLRLLAPPLLPLAGLLGGGGPVLLGGKSAVVAVGAVAVAAAGGLVVLEQRIVNPGEPSPVTLDHEGDLRGGAIVRGRTLPSGVSIVEARVEIPAGKTGPRRLKLQCPTGTVAGNLRPQRKPPPFRIGVDETKVDDPRTVYVGFFGPPLKQAYATTVRLPCRTADRTGSLEANPRRTRPGETPARVCPGHRHYVYVTPGKAFRGTLRAGAPISIVRWSASRQWAYVIADARYIRGWARRSALCEVGRAHG